METLHKVAEPMRAYLLGFLRDDAAAALEEEYFANRAIFLKLQEEEEALIADYLDGRLQIWEKGRFEARYLKVPEMQRKVEEVRRQRAALRAPARRSVWALPRLAYAFVFVIIVGLGLGIWVYRDQQEKQAYLLARLQRESLARQALQTPPPSDALDPNQTVFVASNKMYLVGDTGECAVSPGDILYRTVSEPDENDKVDVQVVISKKGDCPVATNSQLEVSQLQSMIAGFRGRMSSGSPSSK